MKVTRKLTLFRVTKTVGDTEVSGYVTKDHLSEHIESGAVVSGVLNECKIVVDVDKLLAHIDEVGEIKEKEE